MNTVPQLLPGDHLIYWTNCLVDWVIAVKTFSRRAGHIEIYRGDGMSIASRAQGVNSYLFRPEGLQSVLRPKLKPNLVAADKWFKDVAQGQRYDYLGLCCFTLAIKAGNPNKMFCSEFANNWDRAAELQVFNPLYPGDLTPPGMFMSSPNLECVWDAGGDVDYSQPYVADNREGTK